MISVSDNGATDLLLNALGRKKVEAMQRKLAIADPSLNRPFLSTMEFFKLKAAAPLRDRWIGANERGRRAMLAEVNRAPSTELAALFRAGNPVAPDRVEWFLSPLDLARTMDWLRRNTESGPAADARRILALNPGIPPQLAARYGYVGYKGGSEPGVMNMTLLLQSKAGGWRVLTASWLNTQARVDEGRFAMLVSRAAELAVQ
jgi:beta-lactamase class A